MFSAEVYDNLQNHFAEKKCAERKSVTKTFALKSVDVKHTNDDRTSTAISTLSSMEFGYTTDLNDKGKLTSTPVTDVDSPSATPNAGSILNGKATATPPTSYGWRFRAAFACLCLINFVIAIDATILVVALPSMASSLNGTAIEAFWTGTSFLLTSTVFQPSFASMSHIFGRKPVLLFALVLFTIGSVIATAANTFTVLLVARSIQGIGGGGLTALTYVIVSDMVTLRERGKWFSLINLQWAVGSVTGPVIGGAFVEKATWRWIFIFNFPFILVAFLAIPIFLKLNIKVGSIMQKLKAFDWIGSFLFIASITSFLVPLSWGGVMFSWSSWHTLVPLLIGLAGLAGFFLYSIRYSAEPLIRGSIFNTSTAIVGFFGTVFHGIIVWSVIYYMPLYYEVAKVYSPITSGVALFPLTFTAAPAAIAMGLIIAKTGKYRPGIYVGWATTTLGLGIMVLLDVQTTVVQFIFLTLVVGTGTGILYSAQAFAVQAGASNADLPFAAAMYSFFKNLGQTLGVAISGVVFQNVFKSKLASNANALVSANADEWARDASALVEVLKYMQEGAVRDQVIDAYVQSLRIVWIVLCAFSAMAMVVSFVFVKELGLDRELETEQGWVGEKKVADEEVAK